MKLFEECICLIGTELKKVLKGVFETLRTERGKEQNEKEGRAGLEDSAGTV